MYDTWNPKTRIPDGQTVRYDGTVDDRGWSAQSPALQVGAVDIERPRRTPDELFGDDANPESVWDRLGSWL